MGPVRHGTAMTTHAVRVAAIASFVVDTELRDWKQSENGGKMAQAGDG
jgi:hypothetical protein